MTDSQKPLTDWIGATELREEEITLAPALAALATLDDTTTTLEPGSPLPWLWQWFYFLPRAPMSGVGRDGHPKRGGFLPPVTLPRRMFAGARMAFHQPLVIGKPAQRLGTIKDVSEKSGSTGKLVFVKVGYRFSQDGQLCIEEEQDIVYREAGGRTPAPVPAPFAALPEASLSRVITPDPVLLFRFSALTFNSHRIHYDRPYATTEEGYPGLVVHGPLTAVMLMDMVRRSGGPTLKGFSFRGRAPLFDLAPFRLVGRADEGKIALEAQAPDGAIAMTATAETA
ncbi:MAG: acyl-CoA dehydrogenase [Azospirillum sp.]|nr:acyl-CoA dehydrogenase [Azospirillum sp.]